MAVSTYSTLAEALDDVIEVGTGSLPIGRQTVHFNLRLLGEDVSLNIVVLS